MKTHFNSQKNGKSDSDRSKGNNNNANQGKQNHSPKNDKGYKSAKKDGYDYSKPMDAQGLGDEWDDYAWTADDF